MRGSIFLIAFYYDIFNYIFAGHHLTEAHKKGNEV